MPALFMLLLKEEYFRCFLRERREEHEAEDKIDHCVYGNADPADGLSDVRKAHI